MRRLRSDTKAEGTPVEETTLIDILPAEISKPQEYSPEYLEEQIEHVERLNKRLQQIVRTLSGGKLLPEVMLRAMLFEAGKLRNEVDSRREHVREVLKEIKLQASRKALNSPSPKLELKEQENQVQESDLTIQDSENRRQRLRRPSIDHWNLSILVSKKYCKDCNRWPPQLSKA